MKRRYLATSLRLWPLRNTSWRCCNKSDRRVLNVISELDLLLLQSVLYRIRSSSSSYLYGYKTDEHWKVLEIDMLWLDISTWKQSQPQSTGSRKWTGSKVEAKSMERARRNGFEMNCQAPTTVKHRSISTIKLQQILIIKRQTPTFLKHWTPILFDFATVCPLPEKYI